MKKLSIVSTLLFIAFSTQAKNPETSFGIGYMSLINAKYRSTNRFNPGEQVVIRKFPRDPDEAIELLYGVIKEQTTEKVCEVRVLDCEGLDEIRFIPCGDLGKLNNKAGK